MASQIYHRNSYLFHEQPALLTRVPNMLCGFVQYFGGPFRFPHGQALDFTQRGNRNCAEAHGALREQMRGAKYPNPQNSPTICGWSKQKIWPDSFMPSPPIPQIFHSDLPLILILKLGASQSQPSVVARQYVPNCSSFRLKSTAIYYAQRRHVNN